MNVSHMVGPTGHYVTLREGRRSMDIRTERGTSAEMLEVAADMQHRAERLLNQAAFIRQGVSRLQWED